MEHVFPCQAKHMVIPYMPMLIPPICWTGFVFVVYFLEHSLGYMMHLNKF
jgi:hypothetical protein